MNDTEVRMQCLRLAFDMTMNGPDANKNAGAVIRRAIGFYNFVTKGDVITDGNETTVSG
jgi:hypothetical protein